MNDIITSPHLDFLRFKRWCEWQQRKQSDPNALKDYFNQQPHDIEFETSLALAERLGHDIEYGALRISPHAEGYSDGYKLGYNKALDDVLESVREILFEDFGLPVKPSPERLQFPNDGIVNMLRIVQGEDKIAERQAFIKKALESKPAVMPEGLHYEYGGGGVHEIVGRNGNRKNHDDMVETLVTVPNKDVIYRDTDGITFRIWRKKNGKKGIAD